MLVQSKRKTNFGVGGGFLAFVLAAVCASQPALFLLLFVVAIGAFVYGCTQYAQGKGYPALLGLLGLVGFLGLIVLAVLPDKYKCCDEGGEDCTHGRATPSIAAQRARTTSRAA